MLKQADKHKITAMAQIPLYSLTDEQIEGMLQVLPCINPFFFFLNCTSLLIESLSTLESSGSRVVVLADSNTNDQIAILDKAM